MVTEPRGTRQRTFLPDSRSKSVGTVCVKSSNSGISRVFGCPIAANIAGADFQNQFEAVLVQLLSRHATLLVAYAVQLTLPLAPYAAALVIHPLALEHLQTLVFRHRLPCKLPEALWQAIVDAVPREDDDVVRIVE